ncbi:MAG: hypothetical protein AAGA60_02005 [Cyanobacteria bacterium P01_E01_bin.42]
MQSIQKLGKRLLQSGQYLLFYLLQGIIFIIEKTYAIASFLWKKLRKTQTRSPKTSTFLFTPKQLFKKLSYHEIAALSLLILCLLFMGLFFVPAKAIFEGNLIVEEVSFTYNGESDRLFLNTIRNLQRIELEGQQSLILLGQFESQENPEFADTEILEINLNYPDSKLIIEPINLEDSSSLGLEKLYLPSQSNIRHLTYDARSNQLDFTLETQNPPELEAEEDLDFSIESPLQLSVSDTPLRIVLEGYQFPALENASEEYNIIEFTWIPLISELYLSLPNLAKFNITLPELNQTNSSEWFWGKLAVTDVQFYRTLETENVPEKLQISTILKGTVRSLKEELELKANQFPIFKENQGIDRFPHIRIHPDDPPGLEIRIHGTASQIAAGLDRDFPVGEIQANLLKRWLPEDLINVLLTFCAVAIGYLVPWLFTQKS